MSWSQFLSIAWVPVALVIGGWLLARHTEREIARRHGDKQSSG